MSFETANIDRTIVLTQYDLREYYCALQVRMAFKTYGARFEAITATFVSRAIGLGKEGAEPTDESYVMYSDSSFENYLVMCKRLTEACDLSQKDAIQLIIWEIVKQYVEIKAVLTVMGQAKFNNY